MCFYQSNMHSPHRRSSRSSAYPAVPPLWSAADLWRAFPIRPRPRDPGRIDNTNIAIVPERPRRYPGYRLPPVNSYQRYPTQRDIREWEDYDDEYEAPTARNVDRDNNVRQLRHMRAQTTDDRDERSLGRSSRDSRDKVDFAKACTKLKKLLNTAVKQFKKLEQEFQEETKLIEKYASKRILDDLWRRKIGADQETEENDDLDDIDQEMQTHASKSYFLERKVIVCLTRIVEASVDGGKDDIERQSDMLLQTKIEAAMQCIRGIWPKINSSRKQCSRLLTELTQLYEVLKAAYPESSQDTRESALDESNNQDENGIGGGQNLG